MSLLDRVLDFQQSLCLAAFSLYLIDGLRLIAPGQLLLSERSGGRFFPRLSRFPLEFKGKEFYGPDLLLPWRGVFTMPWEGAPAPAPEAMDIARADQLRRRLWVARVGSTVNFLLMFVMAPVLTQLAGLALALMLVLPAVYLINVLVAIDVYRGRERLGLTSWRVAVLAADALLCPPWGANWVKRIVRTAPALEAALPTWQRMRTEDQQAVQAVIASRQAEA